jgi:hypothetical protein
MTTYHGGCHCGAVRFEVDAAEDVALDCNCSMCTMKGFLHLIVPESALRILRGEGALAVYTLNTGVAKHMFCRTCGIHPFYRPRSHPDQWDVNVRCLDGDAPSSFRVERFDGRNWEANVESIR